MARKYTQEELDACGTANCGCVNHAEQEIPCQHDLALLYGTSVEEQSHRRINSQLEDPLTDADIVLKAMGLN